jgi:hypothetical protein
MTDDVQFGSLPTFITVGPVLDRQFDATGRLVIDLDDRQSGSWTGTPMEPWVAAASRLAMLIDALDPMVDIRVGASHRFILNSRVDERVDTRGGLTPPTRHAYGALAVFALDIALLRERVSFMNSQPGPALAYYPRGGGIVQQLGPGASWYRNGRADYFDQILSFETEHGATRLSRATEKARSRWDKAESKWAKHRSSELASLEGPWL